MRIKSVDFPDAVLDAQQTGSLVIFAGAGVSMSPPSNYPNFDDLANQIAGGALEREHDKRGRYTEPVDRFLGRLATSGVQVHATARDLLSDPNSLPNVMHHALLQLFPSASLVRLVTTNFDSHFSTAASAIFSEPVDTYYAPALPLGDDFQGLVYLHGSVQMEPRRLVLTDADFGHAYLTDGWATRFLQALFARDTVLFVGYSHNDLIVQYLARGLPSHQLGRRFALATEADINHWRYFGITPVTYPLRRRPAQHKSLTDAVQAWSEHACRGILEQEQRIRRIVQVAPTRDPEETDYIARALTDVATAQFFTRHAHSPEWLQWMETQEVFLSLFQTDRQVADVGHYIAYWFAHSFVGRYPAESLSVVQRHGPLLNMSLWVGIARYLAYDLEPLAPAMLASWVAVLLHSPQPPGSHDFLEHLLMKCCHPDDDATALLLFDYLVTPQVQLRPHFSLPLPSADSPGIDIDVSVRGTGHRLLEVWRTFFEPNLNAFTEMLAPMLTRHIQHAYLLLRATGHADDLLDPISHSRAAIEPHAQNRYAIGEETNILVDAARDVVGWLVKHRSGQGDGLIEAWGHSGVPLLRRLAIYAISESPFWSADAKIAWLLERNWLYTYGLKHEVFQLLQGAYPKASTMCRLELLKVARLGPRNPRYPTELNQYLTYALLFWLAQVDPACTLAGRRYRVLQQRHPSWSPPTAPDFDQYVSPVTPLSVESLLTREELLRTEPKQALEQLLAQEQTQTGEMQLEHLWWTVTDAVAQSFEWSWGLAEALQDKVQQDRALWHHRLWRCIFQGWWLALTTDDDWARALALLETHEDLGIWAEDAARLLETGPSHRVPDACQRQAETVAERIWQAIANDVADASSTNDDWHEVATRHPGGIIVAFWLSRLADERKVAPRWTGLSEDNQDRLAQVLTGDSTAAQAGRIILANHLNLLFALDEIWTHENLVPLLNWSANKRQAQQAWHGYLAAQPCHEDLLPVIMPFYEQVFSHVRTDIARQRDRLSDHLAAIALYCWTTSALNPLRSGWLGKFLHEVDVHDRVQWAFYIELGLRALPRDAIAPLWAGWLNEYLIRRSRGQPVPLDHEEYEYMVEWTTALEPVFDEAVDRICALPSMTLPRTVIYHNLKENDVAARHPEAVTRLLLQLLRARQLGYLLCPMVDPIVQQIIQTADPRHGFLQLCDELGRLGCPHAAAFKQAAAAV